MRMFRIISGILILFASVALLLIPVIVTDWFFLGKIIYAISIPPGFVALFALSGIFDDLDKYCTKWRHEFNGCICVHCGYQDHEREDSKCACKKCGIELPHTWEYETSTETSEGSSSWDEFGGYTLYEITTTITSYCVICGATEIEKKTVFYQDRSD